MAMAGVGTGLSIAPLAVHARFSQPAERNAIVSALTLFVCLYLDSVPPDSLNVPFVSSSAHLVAQSALRNVPPS